ncbi:MAG: 4Fe-4S dicluster domain-containing protein [Bacteroidales bacterium]|nr:4Fe-4S dicluster domain-containing protein [Bacteroidales bacterium]
MVEFGFKLSPSSRINLDLRDKASFSKLVEIEPDALKCMACGSCTASCSAGIFEETSLRSALLGLQNGDKEKALKLLSHCMFCGKCTMVCPRGINTRHLILSINKIYQVR